MTSILYPWKTTASILKTAADSVVGNKDNKGKGNNNGAGGIGKGGNGGGLGNGRGGGAGVGGKPPGGGGANGIGAFEGIYYYFNAADTTGMYTDTSLTTSVSTDGDLVKGWQGSDGTYGAVVNDTTPPTYKTGIVNGQSVVRFSQTEYLTSWPSNVTNPAIDGDDIYYYMLVANLSAPADTWHYIFAATETSSGPSNSGLQIYRYQGKYYPEFSSGGSTIRILTAAGDFPSTTAPNAISGSFRYSTDSFLTENFGDTKTGPLGSSSSTHIVLGSTATAKDMDFDLCELLVIDHELDTTELDTLKAEWDDRWGTSFV
jgi:hypothetical protein